MRGQDGTASLEFGLLLPLFLVLLVAGTPVIRAGWEYMVLDRAVAHAVRYASRADVNPRTYSGGLTRRPTAAEVEAFVTQAASPLVPKTVTVTPEPARALPGEPITVEATVAVSFGPVAATGNALRSLFFGAGGSLPQEMTLRISATGREE